MNKILRLFKIKSLMLKHWDHIYHKYIILDKLHNNYLQNLIVKKLNVIKIINLGFNLFTNQIPDFHFPNKDLKKI